ncbi:glycosyltransferase family 2 protein [Tessaracoccus sp. MC1679]|uniref:glycosyltransferase family A protein n=1 Tax=Tessaracoccus sp. MC1679 TaxID=2760313 RepID=UPI0016039FFC|nr:glycosyltransferase family A protein [Tessaracoccus sp. MC1679]MBB1517120.1 glycosyltransferase family 2 protein [Tessaracoccus sp. MC1679]
MTLVSIIVPCFNYGATLDETMRSALEQDHSEIEVILVDDGSTDALTLDRVAFWQEQAAHDHRIKVIQQENRGLSAARNAGIASSLGDYFLPLDSDDLIDPRYCRLAAEVLDNNQDIGIVYCRAELFGDQSGEWPLPEFSMDAILVENCIFATSLFRRADWARAGGYDQAMHAGLEDHDFNLKVLSLGRRVHRIDEVLFFYRRHSGSMARALSEGAARDKLIASYAQLFRNNSNLYLANAEAFWRGHFACIDERNWAAWQRDKLMQRYRHLERLRETRLVRKIKGILHAWRSRNP